MFSYSDYFGEATKVLRRIIQIENDNISYFENVLKPAKYKGPRVTPKCINDSILNEYKALKEEYQCLVLKLLNIRAAFGKKLIIDALPTLTTQQDEISEAEDAVEK